MRNFVVSSGFYVILGKFFHIIKIVFTNNVSMLLSMRIALLLNVIFNRARGSILPRSQGVNYMHVANVILNSNSYTYYNQNNYTRASRILSKAASLELKSFKQLLN